MGAKLYVGNLPFSADENAVRELFAKAGTVESVKIVSFSKLISGAKRDTSRPQHSATRSWLRV